MNTVSAIKCLYCKYYQVTWDAEKPFGCSKLNFKSRVEPSNYVIQVSGNVCQCFSKKPIRK